MYSQGGCMEESCSLPPGFFEVGGSVGRLGKRVRHSNEVDEAEAERGEGGEERALTGVIAYMRTQREASVQEVCSGVRDGRRASQIPNAPTHMHTHTQERASQAKAKQHVHRNQETGRRESTLEAEARKGGRDTDPRACVCELTACARQTQ